MDSCDTALRHDWRRDEIRAIHDRPLPDLMYAAQTVHRSWFAVGRVQRSTLLSIKTGGCPEDCAYCPQSSRYDTGVAHEALLPADEVLSRARAARAEGSTRFCMGTAWREVRDGRDFDHVLDLVGAVSGLGLEVCCTLGMMSGAQARRLKEAGCYAYNHNLDTSPEYYSRIITTRTYQARLETLENVRRAGLTVCCGGIIGMGESVDDRMGLLGQLAALVPHPESVPINTLVRVEGTPLAHMEAVSGLELVRMIATARIIMPRSMIRLSAGRVEMSDETQALCFLAGANSIFAGEKLLTTPNPGCDQDRRLMGEIGMRFVEDASRDLRPAQPPSGLGGPPA